MAHAEVVDLRSVTTRYSKTDIGVEDATFAIQPGEFVFIVGASGSGKSTLVRLLIKEMEPSYGSITVAGEPGWHFIDMYPGIYQGSETRPANYKMPQLTALDDHPGNRLPIFRFAFLVQ